MRWLVVVAVLIALAVLATYGAGSGWLGSHEEPGSPADAVIPAQTLQERSAAQLEASAALEAEPGKQILFGDLHVHTTFSSDAYLISLPLMQGEGAHPPADACDFARFCSALDFWSINDHAEALTERHWREMVDSIRVCNEVAAGGDVPDVIAFLGWEWTHVARTPDAHYGHKNVVLAHTEDERIPARPIGSRPLGAGGSPWGRGWLALSNGGGRYLDLARYLQERADRTQCPRDVPVRELPADCYELAATPGELYAKLRDWGHDAIVIPHGTAWGFGTPPGVSWDKQLTPAQHDPALQSLIEVHSGHGNSEEYRSFRAVGPGPDGNLVCPAPSDEYLPMCWRAGEIIEERCLAAGLDQAECETRAEQARANYLQARIAGHLTVPGTSIEDWQDAGQCRDCFLPAFNYRPAHSVQYISVIGNFEDPARPLFDRFGFIGSSDNHKARPGTGYKEYARQEMTEATGAAEPGGAGLGLLTGASSREPEPRSISAEEALRGRSGFGLRQGERQASFFVTGGLAAVHAERRDREAIWEAFQRKEVYGSSGPRILLWFDLTNSPDGPRPMGSSAELELNPRFEVRAAGSFEQLPGCPDYTTRALSAERIQHICRGECYHPSDRRRLITRIEVVRIRPQLGPDEDPGLLIEDPWQVLACEPDRSGCRVEFEDAEYLDTGRDTLYYVRAIEEPSLAVNAGNLRCEYDDSGRCVRMDPCFGDGRTPYDEPCLAETEERAWSSPIWLDHPGAS